MATRILYLITKANWGGAQRYVYDLSRAVKERGYAVSVAYGEEGPLAPRLRASGIPAERIRGLARDVGWLREARAFFSLLRLLRRERPDIIHINSSKAGILGCLAARCAGVPRIIFTAHGWAFNEARPHWQKFLIRLAVWVTILLSSKTICVSEAVRRAVAWIPCTRSKLVVIHNGIECAALLSREEARAALATRAVGGSWIGMVSELHPTKRVEDAIRAFSLIADDHPEAVLVVLGEGEERARLEDLIRELGLGKRVTLAGFVPDAPRHLRAFDLFIHASRSEGLGLAILEAGCASLPVIATRVGGVPEIIENEVSGLLVPPLSPRALAGALEELLANQRNARLLGTALHERVVRDFSHEAMVEKTLAAYAR